MVNSSQQFRGSRLHVLTLLDRVDYIQQINSVLIGSGVSVCSTDKHIPVGSADPREDMLADFLEKHTSFSVQSPDEWWVPRQYLNLRRNRIILAERILSDKSRISCVAQ